MYGSEEKPDVLLFLHHFFVSSFCSVYFPPVDPEYLTEFLIIYEILKKIWFLAALPHNNKIGPY